jgi:rare lipoprotein A (peptidoglycan hydrolase)
MRDRARLALFGAALTLPLFAAAPTRAQTAEQITHHATTHILAMIAPPNEAPVWSDASGSWKQTGVASWYGGRRWQGRRTFSGERFNQNALTAAHATLPMGAKVRVTVADTGRSVVVTINDRPGTRTRIIDLSRAAAAKLGILHRGIATVTLLRD